MFFQHWFSRGPRTDEIKDAMRLKAHSERAQTEVIALARDLRIELERFVAERAKT